ncbi:hypothetical protein BC939DRAFT_463814 [Gamsiella multidivaricata]|uniref:uncharacterized protein n=1 Tax=Gamsiella multidivaricata TaxID=101098 RepID=UPI00221F1F1C|nr:uncharacterized protein BC939DRAFT_463814 [Gamsiella multidivaricata]KAG0360407.1 hypothetical protein BGZ54_009569 [Gamsiella multidivaricata]KAI7818147.1 hypothetical protein BC939DRAFT_463814 [Gamsiella multidivaricata]
MDRSTTEDIPKETIQSPSVKASDLTSDTTASSSTSDYGPEPDATNPSAETAKPAATTTDLEIPVKAEDVTVINTSVSAAAVAETGDVSVIPTTTVAEAVNHDAVDPAIDATAAAAAAAAQAIASAFHDSTADDIKALTKALTTPIEQIEAEEHAAAAAAVAAVAASVAAGTGVDQAAQPETTQSTSAVPAPAFDVNNVYNEALSMTLNQKPPGKRTAQDDFEQNQAARALQLIALSLNSAASQSGDLSGMEANGQTTEEIKTETESTVAKLEEALKEANITSTTAPDVTESLIAISHAINFPSQSADSKPLVDTHAFAQAILNATHADANKTSSLETASLNGDANATSAAGTNGEVSTTSSSAQGFTFEVDKATGKTHIKWTTDPKDDVVSALQDTNAIQQALQTLIAQSGIPGLSDLGVAGGGLLAPPLGQFPAQGSEFGTASDPVASEPAATPMTPARKKRKTGGSATQNTAASIPEGAPSFPCTFEGCDKVFARLYNLKSHSRTHTNERPFICGTCSIAFSRNHDLKRHVKIHGGDKPFKCNGCGKSFSRRDALGRHRGNAKNRAGCSGGSEPATA